jgi:hypothetical protein
MVGRVVRHIYSIPDYVFIELFYISYILEWINKWDTKESAETLVTLVILKSTWLGSLKGGNLTSGKGSQIQVPIRVWGSMMTACVVVDTE